MPELVVIIGPIASGKSTIAAALGEHFRSLGRPVAVVDLDDLVVTIGGFVDLPTERFHQAQGVFGKLVGAWLDQGFDVIAHGPFLEPTDYAALCDSLPADANPRMVLLRTSFEVALERTSNDPTRVVSKQPDFLRATYDRFDELRPTMQPAEWDFDTTTTDWQTIAQHLAEDLVP